MTLKERAIFAASMMVLCGVALPVAVADGNVIGANAAACAMGGCAVVAARRWWQANNETPRRPRRTPERPL